MKRKVIAIVNQKGGVGKTTSTINISAGLAEKNKKILVADMDPQGNTTTGFGIDKSKLNGTIYDMLIGNTYLENIKIKTSVEGLELLPANVDLAGAEVELFNLERCQFALAKYLDNVKYLYDYVIIDCPPSLNILTLNALCAADSVLVPIQCEFYALEGFRQLKDTVERVKKQLNKRLRIEGVVFTMFDARTNLSIQVVDNVKKFLDEDVFTAVIPRNVKLAEAPSYSAPINVYAPKSKGAEAYSYLADLIMGRQL
jgi:chromosome partitioning protein